MRSNKKYANIVKYGHPEAGNHIPVKNRAFAVAVKSAMVLSGDMKN
jgi:hypothetical protein